MRATITIEAETTDELVARMTEALSDIVEDGLALVAEDGEPGGLRQLILNRGDGRLPFGSMGRSIWDSAGLAIGRLEIVP